MRPSQDRLPLDGLLLLVERDDGRAVKERSAMRVADMIIVQKWIEELKQRAHPK